MPVYYYYYKVVISDFNHEGGCRIPSHTCTSKSYNSQLRYCYLTCFSMSILWWYTVIFAVM